ADSRRVPAKQAAFLQSYLSRSECSRALDRSRCHNAAPDWIGATGPLEERLRDRKGRHQMLVDSVLSGYPHRVAKRGARGSGACDGMGELKRPITCGSCT